LALAFSQPPTHRESTRPCEIITQIALMHHQRLTRAQASVCARQITKSARAPTLGVYLIAKHFSTSKKGPAICEIVIQLCAVCCSLTTLIKAIRTRASALCVKRRTPVRVFYNLAHFISSVHFAKTQLCKQESFACALFVPVEISHALPKYC